MMTRVGVIKSIPFCKMQSLGNDFVILDRIDSSIYIDSNFARTLGHRKFGVGFDQLLVLEAPFDRYHDFSFQVFNANGSQAFQCLNGARALIAYIHGQHIAPKECVRLQIGEHSVSGRMLSSTVVRLALTQPVQKYPIETVKINDVDLRISKVSCGNDHIIIWNCKNSDKKFCLGSLKDNGYSFDQYNMTFAKYENNKISLETIERGVGKTLSCGSAALSTYLSHFHYEGTQDPMRLETTSGYITAGFDDGDIFITGPSHKVYRGEFAVRFKQV